MHQARDQNTKPNMEETTKSRNPGLLSSWLSIAIVFVISTAIQDVNGWISVSTPTISSLKNAHSHSSIYTCSNQQQCRTRTASGIILSSISNDKEDLDLLTTTTTGNNDNQMNADQMDQVPNEIPQRQQQQQEEESSLLETINSFLDKPYFDPEQYDESDESFLGKIASLVKADYEFFEALFVACFFLLLLTITKDVLRAQMDAAGLTAATKGKMF